MQTYKQRYLESKVLSSAKHFKAVLILGARQVGKSTMLKTLYPRAESFLFDAILDIYNVRSDPDLFLDLHPAPLLLDEVQFAPALLSAIKRRVDASPEKGRYFLTGSQNLNLLQTVSETMTGRVALLQMEGLSLHEQIGAISEKNWLVRYLDDPNAFIGQSQRLLPESRILTEVLWKGSLPDAIELPLSELHVFFDSYIRTYVDRDVRHIENIQDLQRFGDFLSLLGALSSQEINLSQLGREINITPQTAKRWLFLLGASYQWREVSPLYRNAIKKVAEKRKGYLTDSGLMCHLLRLRSPQDLAVHPLLGSVFETWVCNHIHQLFSACSLAPAVYHWRAHSGAEIDLVLDINGTYFPIEIKCSRNLSQYDLRNFESFRQAHPNQRIAPGLIIHAGEENYLLNKDALALSWKAL